MAPAEDTVITIGGPTAADVEEIEENDIAVDLPDVDREIEMQIVSNSNVEFLDPNRVHSADERQQSIGMTRQRLLENEKKQPSCTCDYRVASCNRHDFQRLAVVLTFSVIGTGLVIYSIVFGLTSDGSAAAYSIVILAVGVALFITGKWILWWLLHYRSRRRHVQHRNWDLDQFREDKAANNNAKKHELDRITSMRCKYFSVDRSDHEVGPCLLRYFSKKFRPEFLHTFEITCVYNKPDGKTGTRTWKVRRSDSDFKLLAKTCQNEGIVLDAFKEENWNEVALRMSAESAEGVEMDQGIARSRQRAQWLDEILVEGRWKGDRMQLFLEVEAQIFPTQESNEVANNQWVDVAFTIQNVEQKELVEDSADWLGHYVIRDVSKLINLPTHRIRVRKLHRNMTYSAKGAPVGVAEAIIRILPCAQLSEMSASEAAANFVAVFDQSIESLPLADKSVLTHSVTVAKDDIGMEGWLYRRTGGFVQSSKNMMCERFLNYKFFYYVMFGWCCEDFIITWEEKWCAVRPGYIAMYHSMDDPDPVGILFFDKDMIVEDVGNEKGGSCFHRICQTKDYSHCIVLKTSYRNLTLMATSELQKLAWKQKIEDALETYRGTNQHHKPSMIHQEEFDKEQKDNTKQSVRLNKKEAMKDKSNCCVAFGRGGSGIDKQLEKNHDLRLSFAPERPFNKIQWYSDGLFYMRDAAQAIKQARKEILITDWFFSPELMLSRNLPPEGDNDHYEMKDNLMELLKIKAHKMGVPVKVLLYAEMGAALPLMSARVKEELEKGNEDPSSKAFIEVLTHSRQGFIEMTGGFLTGESDGMWSHHEKLLICDQELAFVGGIDLAFGRFDTCAHEIIERDAKGNYIDDPKKSMYPGADYYNQRTKDFDTDMVANPNDEVEVDGKQVIRNINTRMPWHDIHMAMMGPTALDIAQHFMQRWNRESREKHGSERQFDAKFTYCMPLNYLTNKLGGLRNPSMWCENFTKNWSNGSAQALRSVGQWSNECQREASIQAAYLRAIENSRHCIYIENQFFVSSTASSTGEVKNKIGEALVSRVIRAIEDYNKTGKDNFLCTIINPLWPGMAGAVVDSVGIQCILAWQQKTIRKGKNSIYGQLAQRFPNSEDIKWKIPAGHIPKSEKDKLQAKFEHFIRFFTLRQHDRRPFEQGSTVKDGYAVTEQIYVHAKLMIVDDQIAIIGSANINDRSLHGDRDSEVCVITGIAHVADGEESVQAQDDNSVKHITMFGEPWLASKFAHTLRVHLWAEHTGMLEKDHSASEEAKIHFEDPRQGYSIFLDYATKNSTIYDKIFPDSPNNEWTTLKDLRKSIDKRSPETYHRPGVADTGHNMLLFAQKRLLSQIRGHICTTSTNFLIESDLTPPATDIYGLMPSVVFV